MGTNKEYKSDENGVITFNYKTIQETPQHASLYFPDEQDKAAYTFRLTDSINNKTLYLDSPNEIAAYKQNAVTQRIEGIVQTQEGEPLPGAIIAIQGTNRKTISDEIGLFSIDADFNHPIVIRAEGMKNRSMNIFPFLHHPEEAYPVQVTKHGHEHIRIGFKAGEPVSLNGTEMDPVELIRTLHSIAAPYGIGRDTHVGDTIIGIKGRVGFEAGAPLLIIAAHKMLEKHTLTKWQQYWKDQLGTWYGMFMHEAQYLEPVMRDIEAFLLSSQENVTGDVIIDLKPYRYILVGVNSDFDLMKTDFGEYGEISKGWTADDVKGFTKILGNQMKIYHNIQVKNGKQL